MTTRETDETTGTETTGHEWDGIKELNTPLPRWWLWTFYGTIIFAIGYVIAYPAIPLISSATSGVLGYSSRAELDASLLEAKAAQGSTLEKLTATPVAEIIEDEELARFARAGGRSLYKVYCSQCHGTGATGSTGYPNLNDDEWIWGGSVDDIYTTIYHGARHEADPDTRFNLMPGFGDGYLSTPQLNAVAAQVASLSGIDGGAISEEGATLYAENCAACHGERGEGMIELGAPSLNDQVWLYEGSLESIKAQLVNPRHGVMPAWGDRLGEAAVKQLAVYVHGLGGGQ